MVEKADKIFAALYLIGQLFYLSIMTEFGKPCEWTIKQHCCIRNMQKISKLSNCGMEPQSKNIMVMISCGIFPYVVHVFSLYFIVYLQFYNFIYVYNV